MPSHKCRMNSAQALTEGGESLQLTLAINYSARQDLAAAARAIAYDVAAGILSANEARLG